MNNKYSNTSIRLFLLCNACSLFTAPVLATTPAEIHAGALQQAEQETPAAEHPVETPTLQANQPQSADDEALEFDSSFLVGQSAAVDLSRYARGNPTPPGTYTVNIYLNDQMLLSTPVSFIANGTPNSTPCLTSELLRQLGVDSSQWQESVEGEDEEEVAKRCVDIKKFVPEAKIKYDSNEQRLDIGLPQIYIVKQPQGYVDPSRWETGINAAMLSYNANVYRSSNDGDVSESAYAGLNYGINLGAWRFRAKGSLNWDQDDGTDYDSQEMFVQRDITALKAQLVLGDSYTDGTTFDSLNLHGLRLYSDDRMHPSSLNGYAPIVRGVANTNAKVTVRQNGSIISQTTVPPGAFEITDLNPTGYGSDLDVTVEEADGSKRTFSVPFSSVVQLMRPGQSRWEFDVGQLSTDSLSTKPNVAQGTWYYGLNNTFTGYIGLQATDDSYYAGLLGVAVNTSLGALALDVTQSSAEIPNDKTRKGQSYRVSYSKLLEATDTSLSVAAYRYSTADYLSLNDVAQMIDDRKHQDNQDKSFNDYKRLRNQVQLSVSQPLGSDENSYGSVYVTGSWQNYWDESRATKQYSAGYSNSFKWGSYSISMQRSYDEDLKKDDSLYVNISIPLVNLLGGGGGEQHHPAFDTLNIGMNSDLKGSSQTNATANGSTEDDSFSYGVNASYDVAKEAENTRQVGGYGTYNSAYGPVSASASFTNDNGRQFSLANSGGVVVHSGGVTFAPGSIGETDSIALINAPGATGAKTTNGDGRIDGRGYAISTSLSPYRENNVGLDISTLEADVEVQSTQATTVPRAGSVVKVEFATNQGRSLLLNLQRNDKGFIPLGATVFDTNGNEVGSVGQAGRAFVRGTQDSGTLKVVWGNTVDQRCMARYAVGGSAQSVGMTQVIDHVMCQVSH